MQNPFSFMFKERDVLFDSKGRFGIQKVYDSKFLKDLRILESKGQITGDMGLSTLYAKKNEFLPSPDTALKLYKDVYNKIPVAKTSVDYTANFGIQSGYQLEGNVSDVEAVESWIKTKSFDFLTLRILKECQVFGNVFLELNGLKILPVWDMRVVVSTAEGQNGELVGYRQIVKNRTIDFSPDEIVHYKWNDMGNSFYGTSDYSAVLTTLTYIGNFQADIGEIIHRYAAPIMHHKLGTDERPATQKQIDDYKELLNNRETGEDMTTDKAVEITPVTANIKMVQPDGMLKHLENQLIAGLQVPEIFIRGGESSNKATADVELQAFDRKVKSLRAMVSKINEDRIFSRIVKTPIYYAWNELSTEGELTKAETFQKLVAPGIGGIGIPTVIALKMVGWGSWVNDVEAELKKNPPQLQVLPGQLPQKPKPV